MPNGKHKAGEMTGEDKKRVLTKPTTGFFIIYAYKIN